jgi:hypothetical protein
VRTKYRAKCAQRAPKPQPIETWARSVVADPSAHRATEREAGMVADLLSQLEVSR